MSDRISRSRVRFVTFVHSFEELGMKWPEIAKFLHTCLRCSAVDAFAEQICQLCGGGLRQRLSTSFKTISLPEWRSFSKVMFFTGPLLTYMGHPRDPQAISDLWPHPSESCHWFNTSPDPSWPGRTGTYTCEEVEITSQYCQCVDTFTKRRDEKHPYLHYSCILRRQRSSDGGLRRFYLAQWGTLEAKLCNVLTY